MGRVINSSCAKCDTNRPGWFDSQPGDNQLECEKCGALICVPCSLDVIALRPPEFRDAESFDDGYSFRCLYCPGNDDLNEILRSSLEKHINVMLPADVQSRWLTASGKRKPGIVKR